MATREEIDYRELLKKYINYLNSIEGSDFIGYISIDDFFTTKEVEELEILKREVVEQWKREALEKR